MKSICNRNGTPALMLLMVVLALMNATPVSADVTILSKDISVRLQPDSTSTGPAWSDGTRTYGSRPLCCDSGDTPDGALNKDIIHKASQAFLSVNECTGPDGTVRKTENGLYLDLSCDPNPPTLQATLWPDNQGTRPAWTNGKKVYGPRPECCGPGSTRDGILNADIVREAARTFCSDMRYAASEGSVRAGKDDDHHLDITCSKYLHYVGTLALDKYHIAAWTDGAKIYGPRPDSSTPKGLLSSEIVGKAAQAYCAERNHAGVMPTMRTDGNKQYLDVVCTYQPKPKWQATLWRDNRGSQPAWTDGTRTYGPRPTCCGPGSTPDGVENGEIITATVQEYCTAKGFKNAVANLRFKDDANAVSNINFDRYLDLLCKDALPPLK